MYIYIDMLHDISFNIVVIEIILLYQHTIRVHQYNTLEHAKNKKNLMFIVLKEMLTYSTFVL